jgi:hypothetical protein
MFENLTGVRTRNFPRLCNTHQVHYHIHSSQLYYSFIYLAMLQYPQYITHEKLSTATVPCYY